MRRIAGTFFVGLTWVTLQAATAHGREYLLVEIPRADNQNLGAIGINEAGQVVGFIDHLGEPQRPWNGFVWTATSGFTDLGEGPGAFAINDAGAVVGRRYDPNHGNGAFLWTASGGVRLLSSLPGGAAFAGSTNSEAVDINNFGQIVGHIYDGGTRAFLRDPDGTVRFLPMPPDAFLSGPFVAGMNDRGDVVGRVNFGDSRYHAFVWPAAGGYRDLGDLPGGLEQGTAGRINSRGDIAGDALVEPDPAVPDSVGQRAVRYKNDGTIVELGVPAGMSDAGMFDMNDLGEVVGRSRLGAIDGLGAILWTEQEGMLDLNDLLDESGRGWTLLAANAINNRGQIVVSGTIDGRYSSALLTPVPEPTGVCAIAVIGQALLPLRRARRR